MNYKTVLLCALAVLCVQSSLTWGGPILNTVTITPSELNGPGGNPGTNYMFTGIACADANSGALDSCSYVFKIKELKQPNSDVANNGGHSHDYSSHPLGMLKVILPNPGLQSDYLAGSTGSGYVYFSHEIPKVSGKIETELDLTVPPGWYTVYPESCDASRTSWCFNTTVDVGVNDLTPLSDASSLYVKVRSADAAHTDAVAFYGTGSALGNLSSIADWYNWIFGRTLSVNDMSLIRGGLFDVHSDYSTPHSWHRTGESVDINKSENGDCTKNKALLLSVYIVMGRNGGPTFANRSLPSFGHFLCETNGNLNKIHIDL